MIGSNLGTCSLKREWMGISKYPAVPTNKKNDARPCGGMDTNQHPKTPHTYSHVCVCVCVCVPTHTHHQEYKVWFYKDKA
jgi:hypothetical protein